MYQLGSLYFIVDERITFFPTWEILTRYAWCIQMNWDWIRTLSQACELNQISLNAQACCIFIYFVLFLPERMPSWSSGG